MIATKSIPDWMRGEHTRDECMRLDRAVRVVTDDLSSFHPEDVSYVLDNANPEMVQLARKLSKRLHARNFGTKAALEVLMRIGILLVSLEEKDGER